MASTAIRERRRTLRYRHLLVRQMVQMKIKARSVLMEAGVSYNKQRLHKAGYFRELLASNPDIDEELVLCCDCVVKRCASGEDRKCYKSLLSFLWIRGTFVLLRSPKGLRTFHRMYAIHLAPADGVNGIYELREDIRLLFEGAVGLKRHKCGAQEGEEPRGRLLGQWVSTGLAVLILGRLLG